eukprot:10161079-Lingulodinium_polyedra.AAC.1
MVHLLRPLCNDCPDEARSSKLEVGLKRLQGKRPGQIGARQMYFKALVAQAAEWKAQGRAMPANVEQTIMKRHAARFKALPQHHKAHFQEMAEQASQSALVS